MVADRYVGETTWSKRIVRERYDQPAPKENRGLTTAGEDAANGHGTNGHGTNARAGARARANADR